MEAVTIFCFGVVLGLAPLGIAGDSSASPIPARPVRGADVSSLASADVREPMYDAAGEPIDLLATLAGSGLNTIRLRLWHDPSDGGNGMDRTLALAQRARDLGLDLILDFHYSDTWADPGQQTLPAAWRDLAYPALRDSVRTYTRDVLLAFRAAGASPVMVQVGNEITAGILWDQGRVGGTFDTPRQWDRLGGLLESAVRGVEEAFAPAESPEIIIHLDRGGDNLGCRRFLDHLVARELPFQIIGVSYYPWWHGDLEELEANLRDLALRYDRDVLIVETAYPWTLEWFDQVHNLVGLHGQLLPGFPATPLGQREFLNAVRGSVSRVPTGRGRGVVYWEPGWVHGLGDGSPWENMTLVRPGGDPLPALRSLGRP